MGDKSVRYYPGLDILKFIMAIMIVAAHTKLLEECEGIHVFLTHLFDMAVPTFFSISAFLFYEKMYEDGFEQSKKIFLHTIKRLLIFYIIWYIIMLPMTYKTFFSIANVKEIIFAALLRSTFGGYWFIKALIFNTILLYLCRKRKNLVFLTIGSILVFIVLELNSICDLIKLPEGLYFSFFYHTPFFVTGAWLVIYKENYMYERKNLFYVLMLIFFLVYMSYIDQIKDFVRMFYPLILIPFFARKASVNSTIFKKMRVSSIIIYMLHFFVIWIYSAWVQNYTDGYVWDLSIVRFCMVLSWVLFISWIIMNGEKLKYLSFLRYLH